MQIQWSNPIYILAGLNVLSIFVTVITFLNIKLNDFKHLAKDFLELKTVVKSLEVAVSDNTTEVAKINERCKVHHKE